MGQVKPIREGFHTVTPAITVRGARDAIAFYERAFGAEKLRAFTSKDGSIVAHAEIRIGDSVVMLSDELPAFGFHSPKHYGGTSSSLYVSCADVDARHARAVAAGATSVSTPTDMFGERMGSVVCPFGHRWTFATHIADVSDDDVQRQTEAFFASNGT